MFDEKDRRLNEATDARTNQPSAMLPLVGNDVAGLGELQRRWASLPMTPRVVPDRSEGIDHSWPGFDIRTVLLGEDSAGRFTFHHVILSPGAGLPSFHLGFADTYIYILDGELELTVGALTETARSDAFAFVPEGTTQGFRNISTQPATFFLWHSPAGPERAFAAAHKAWLDTGSADQATYQAALATLGFSFHHADEKLENDARTNASVEKLEAHVERFEDFAALRVAWSQRAPVPKILHDRRQADDIPINGQDTKVLLNGDEGSGRCVVMHYGIEPGYCAPPHHQPSEEEIFLVLEGEVDLTIGNCTARMHRGGFGFTPRYGTHSFINPTKDDARTITINSPAGHERGFQMMAREGGSEALADLLVAHGWHVHAPYQPA